MKKEINLDSAEFARISPNEHEFIKVYPKYEDMVTAIVRTGLDTKQMGGYESIEAMLDSDDAHEFYANSGIELRFAALDYGIDVPVPLTENEAAVLKRHFDELVLEQESLAAESMEQYVNRYEELRDHLQYRVMTEDTYCKRGSAISDFAPAGAVVHMTDSYISAVKDVGKVPAQIESILTLEEGGKIGGRFYTGLYIDNMNDIIKNSVLVSESKAQELQAAYESFRCAEDYLEYVSENGFGETTVEISIREAISKGQLPSDYDIFGMQKQVLENPEAFVDDEFWGEYAIVISEYNTQVELSQKSTDRLVELIADIQQEAKEQTKEPNAPKKNHSTPELG